MNDRALRDLIDAVESGDPIDWQSARRRIDDPAIVHAAQVLARLAASGRSASTPGTSALNPFLRLTAAVAVLQICAGSTGMALSYLWAPSATMLARLGIVASFSSVSIWLYAGRTDVRAAWLATYYVLTAAAFAQPGFAIVAAAGAGTWAEGYLSRGFCVEALLPFTLWRFARLFPASLRLSLWDRVAQAGAIATGCLAATLWTANLLLAGQHGVGVTGAFDRLDATGSWFWPVILIAAVAALAMMVTRSALAAPDERRRVRLFLAALLAGALPLIVEVLLETFVPAFRVAVTRPRVFRMVAPVIYLSLLTIPFGTAWAVVSKRALDVRVVVKHAVQYLLARRVLQVVTVAPFGILLAYAIAHRKESLVDLFSGPAAASLLFVSAAGVIMSLARRPLQRVIDRAFGRIDEDVHRVLAVQTERLRHVRTIGELADVVRTAADSALSADASMLIAGGDRSFHAVHGATPPLSSESAIAALLGDGEPLAVGSDMPASVFPLLPAADRAWVIETGAAVLVAIRGTDAANTARAVLVCGERRDALRPGQRDTAFLQALAAGAAIALDRVSARNVDDESERRFHELASECDSCGQICGEGASCRGCGGVLRVAALPQRIHGKYELQARIGRGGMGIVYRARDLHLGRLVAIKTLPRVAGDERSRLLTEAQAMATIVHPHVASIHAVEIWRTTPLLVVELLEGGSLAQRLASGPMAVADVIELGMQLAQALEYVHAKGFLHLDIKPANVGFAADGTVKLLDFGLAAIQRPADAIGQPLSAAVGGTLPYMSPEARAGQPATAAYDLWALCVLLFVASSGAYPPAARVGSRGSTDRHPVHGADVTPLAGFFARAFDPAPHLRWPTAAAIRHELEKVHLEVLA